MGRKARAEQLPLHLPLEAARAREDLIVGDANAAAVAFLDAWPDWPGPVAVLSGPEGSGKTHLAHVWAARAGARFLPLSADHDAPDEPHGPLVVEDARRGAFAEAWLFHLINAVRAAGTSLLITSDRTPVDWGLALPDLKSRIRAATVLEIAEPDDMLLRGALMKLFADRQLQVDAQVLDYLLLRMERSLVAARDIVDILDRKSLAEHRPVTRPLAAEALAEVSGSA